MQSSLYSKAEAWERTYAGWAATEAGYWYPDGEARDLLRVLRTSNQEAEHWYLAYQEMKDAALENAADLSGQIEALKVSLAEERAAADRVIEKAVKAGKGWGFGVFAGVGYGSGGELTPVIGVGLVWKVF